MAVGSSRRKRIIQVAVGVVLGLLVLLYIGLPVAMAVVAVWPSRAEVGAVPVGFTEVDLTTSDDVRLAAWYAPAKNGAAVVLVHGAGASRESMKPLASMLMRHGYGVLSLDARGHGLSEGTTNRYGWQGTRDVRAAVDYLLAQDAALRIGGLGSSMGGEVLLGASAACPEMTAIVADGATRRCTAELLALPSERSLVRNFTARVSFAAVGLFASEDPPPPLLEEMQRAAATEFLLFAAGDEALEVAFNEHFAATLGERAELWVVEGVGHTGAFAAHPEEYETRVIDLFESALGESGSRR